MLYDNTDFNYEISLFQIPGNDLNNYKNKKFLNYEEGFERGNSEIGTFIPYKQYTYFKLKPETEQEKMLLQLMAYTFAITDLNLYLDLHPEDNAVFEQFKNYAEKLDQLEMNYVKKYGPMCVTQTDGVKYDWLKNPWPWDNKGGSMYV